MIDIKTIEATMSALGMIFGAVALAVTWLTRGSRTNARKIARLEGANADLADRVADMEMRLSNLPTKDDFHQLDLQLREVGGRIETVSTRLEGVDRVARRIDDFLLNRGTK
ncbi:DUF2730 family protein [Roseibium litorale]|uniref:DUF2730 family protein n=1 Tax=Roseibium litorale TaxID=2803841 RepID=A0ABR9CJB0_9HYPH|nr:DUF2730 family protein [Roseibium litorale]MBD8890912.1 DUF2730 family protein [Roseibium litorale]